MVGRDRIRSGVSVRETASPAALVALLGVLLLAGCDSGGEATAPPRPADGSATVEVPPAAKPGQVSLLRNAVPEFDRFIAEASPSVRNFMGNVYDRMRGFPPAFDPALRWAPPTHAGIPLYAIYTQRRSDGLPDPGTLERHPDWVLRDAAGEPLFIPWRCDGTRCTQWAADIGNPEWRREMIRIAGERLDRGYAGLHIDDVNLEWRVGDADGNFVRPVDPRTGEPMSFADWKRYIAEFAEEFRAAFPEAEITHNPLWFADREDPFVRRQLKAADWIQLERGYNDEGLIAGDGEFGFDTFLAHIDFLHELGTPIILEPYLDDETGAEYELAGYLLTREGKDLLAPRWRSQPGDLWPGWRTNLGAPEGPRYEWMGVHRRDYERGFVLLNPPEADPVTLPIESGFERVDGSVVSEVVLPARTGAVFSAQ